MENNSFDNFIKQKIEHPSVEMDARAWDLFMLTAIEKGEEDIFEDASADALVREGLKDFKVAYDPTSWDVLADKIDTPEEEPVVVHQKFDKEISNSLRDLRRKYDAASWPKLAAHLDAEERYIRHYYRAKFVEAVVFFLLVITLFQMSQSSKVKSEIENIATPKINQEVASRDLAGPQVSGSTAKAQTYHLTTPLNGSIKKGDFNTGRLTESLPTKDSPAMIDAVVNLSTSGTGSIRDIFNLASLRSDIDRTSAARKISEDKINLNVISAENSILGQDLASTLFDAIPGNVPGVSFSNQSLPSMTIKSIKKGVWKVGMYTHLDYNQIYFPDQIVSVLGEQAPYKAKTVHSSGYGVGFKALYSKKQFGLETGIGYANRAYSPNRKYYIDPYYNADFANIEYEIVEMPLSVRYAAKKDSRVRPYAQVGLNANFITRANYDIVAESKLARTFTSKNADLTAQQEYILSKARDQFTKFDKRRVLVYAQGSTGLEWKINSTADIYSQITFGQRLLSRQFGPNFDQFKTLSMEIGLRTKI